MVIVIGWDQWASMGTDWMMLVLAWLSVVVLFVVAAPLFLWCVLGN
jgi:hypothetical protein